MVRKLKMKYFNAFGFIIVNILFLYFNSSIKRGYEASNYVERNERELLSMVEYFKNHGEDSALLAMRKDMNITSVEFVNGNYHFDLYYDKGYAYGLTYTDSLQLATPEIAYNRSPIIKWIKVKPNWYYYSYFD